MSKKTIHPLIRVLILLLLLLVVIALLGFVTIRRSFPKVDGRIEIPGLSEEVEIIRDSMGVPHIYASNERDLFLAQGYVHAQDRFFQMDLWRHIGAGRLSEMFGKSQVETDIFLRTMGWSRIAQEEAQNLDPSARNILQAYEDGVNAYLSEHQGAEISFEHALLGIISSGYKPELWDITHTLTWAKVMAFDLSENSSGWQDLTRAKLYKQLGAERAADLDPLYPSKHPFIVPEIPFRETQSEMDSPTPDLSWINSSIGIGSNSWVISGERTTTGAPLLANDPHLGIQIPAIWYEVGLHCKTISETCRFNVTGFSFAGAPGVIIGHNDNIAWGLTNVGPDVLDLFIEKVNPDNPNQYEVNGEWEDMTLIDEVIQVAGGEPINITVRRTRHGPVFSDVDESFKDLATTTLLYVPSPYAVSVRWTALEPSSIFQAFLNMNKATDWASFRDALREFNVPSQNAIFADVKGNIGYQTPGNIPIRTKGDGLLPVPGWTDEYDWLGYIPFDELPSSYNPPQGFIVTANNAIVDSEYPYLISKTWDLGYRAHRITELIESHDKVSIEDIQAIQGDNYNAMAPILIPILNSLSFEQEKLSQYVADLEGWDYQNEAGCRQTAIFNVFWRHLVLKTFSDEIPENIPNSSYAFLLIENLVTDPQNIWWDDVGTSAIETRDEIMIRAFSDAITELEQELGKNDEGWSWGDLHTSTFSSNLGIGPLSLIFNRGPFPTNGGSNMVNNTAWNEAEGYDVVALPSMRMIVDFSNMDNSFTVFTTGQSGHAFHPHYIDMTDLWLNNLLHPMLWTREQVEASSKSILTLTPQ